jgi:hypothetical protein
MGPAKEFLMSASQTLPLLVKLIVVLTISGLAAYVVARLSKGSPRLIAAVFLSLAAVLGALPAVLQAMGI